jgi:ribosomal protein L9
METCPGLFKKVGGVNFGYRAVYGFQRRFFEWDPQQTRKTGKPSITGTKSAYVAAQIPVVLVKDVLGIGSSGDIVHVKRGLARNNLVASGLAVYGTRWDNIDRFAAIKSVDEDVANRGNSMSLDRSPMDWIGKIELNFTRDTHVIAAKAYLVQPITLREVLMSLSIQEHVDFLPAQVVAFPTKGIEKVGNHSITLSLSLDNRTQQFSFVVMIKDKAELAATERREAELMEAMKLKRPDFVLGSSRFTRIDHSPDSLRGVGDTGSDDESEEGDNS